MSFSHSIICILILRTMSLEMNTKECLDKQYMITMFVVTSLNECMKQCVARTSCLSLNYRRDYLLCELMSVETGQFVLTSIETGRCVHIVRANIPNFKELSDCKCSRLETCLPMTNKCVIRECPFLEIDNVFVKGNTNQIGAVVSFECRSPLLILENPNIKSSTCLNNGIWGYYPTCKTKYLGCYMDDSERNLMPYEVTPAEPLTIERCLQYCFEYKYAAPQYSSHCFCGNYLDSKLKRPESDCNMRCQGNSSQICGGGWRGSVYLT